MPKLPFALPTRASRLPQTPRAKARFGLMLPLLTAAALFSATSAAEAEGAKRLITVTGEASVAKVPDMAMLTIGVTNRGETAAAALAANTTAMSQVSDKLKASGITGRDLQTSGLSLSPNRDSYSPSGSSEGDEGFTASNMLSVTIRDLDGLGALIDQLAAEGATNLHGISFALQEPRPAQDEARKAAVEDARAKAGLLAEAAGVSLGDLTAISEGAGYGGGQPVMLRAAEASVPVERGEVSYQASVTISWEIKD